MNCWKAAHMLTLIFPRWGCSMSCPQQETRLPGLSTAACRCDGKQLMLLSSMKSPPVGLSPVPGIVCCKTCVLLLQAGACRRAL